MRYLVSTRPFFDDTGAKFSREWWVLLLFTLTLLILSVWGMELSGRDSPRVAGIAREMAETSDYLIPRLNGESFFEYPPLGYWPMALSLSVNKYPSSFLGFLPIVFLGTGTVLITCLIGKELAGERIGLMAGFILSTMSSFITYHRHLRVDPTLLFFVTLSLYGFVKGYQTSKKSYPLFAVYYLAIAGGFLSKGIIGMAIPAITAVVFLVSKKDFTTIRKLLLNPGILFFLLPILFWAGSVWWFEGPALIKEVIRQSLWRFFSSSADHSKPLYFYLIHVFLAPMPWIALPFVLFWYGFKPDCRKKSLPCGSLVRFALVWFLTGFIGLSLASAKRPLYLGLIYPSLALLASLGWSIVRDKFPRIRNLELHGLLTIFLVYVGIYLVFICPVERRRSLRPVFEAVINQGISGPIYLVNPSETIRGASFFYLGRRIPVLKKEDLLSGRFEDGTGTAFVIDSLCEDNQFDHNLQSRGYRLILRKTYAVADDVCIYSKGF